MKTIIMIISMALFMSCKKTEVVPDPIPSTPAPAPTSTITPIYTPNKDSIYKMQISGFNFSNNVPSVNYMIVINKLNGPVVNFCVLKKFGVITVMGRDSIVNTVDYNGTRIDAQAFFADAKTVFKKGDSLSFFASYSHKPYVTDSIDIYIKVDFINKFEYKNVINKDYKSFWGDGSIGINNWLVVQ